MYPMFILVVVIGVVSIMMTMVVPKLLDIFENKDALPVSTKMLMGLSNAFSQYWYIMLLMVIGFITFVSIWKKTPN